MTATVTGHPYSNIARRNLVLNPRPASTAQWSTTVNATGLTLSGVATKYLAWTAIAAGASSIGQIKNMPIDGVTPISARAACTTSNAPNTARLVHIQLRFYDGSGTQLSLVNGPDAWVSNPVFTTVKFENVTPPAGATQVAIYIVGTANAASERFFANLISLEQAPAAADYFDGDTAGDANTEYAWAGERAASASLKRVKSASDVITPTTVLAPWTAESESMSTLHPYMDDPSTVIATWRKPGPRQGSLDMLFDSPGDATAARRVLATHAWFELDDTDYRYVDQFVLTPGQPLAYGQVQEGTLVAATRKTRWHVVAPWTEVML